MKKSFKEPGPSARIVVSKSQKRDFNVLDLFCGTGAISYGLKSGDARFKVVGGLDVNPSACATASANHIGGTFLCKSITEMSPKQFSDRARVTRVDMVVGGPPCQGLSSLRPNRQTNINDPRNRLYKGFVDYVRYFEPTVFLMENVIGLVNHADGRLLQEILTAFSSIGYATDWRILNAANYGVPQKRERIIITGVSQRRVARPALNYPAPTHFFDGRVIGTRYKSNYIVNPTKGTPSISLDMAISDLPKLRSGEAKHAYSGPPRTEYQKQRRSNSQHLTLHEAADHSEKMLKVMRLAGSSKGALPAGLVSSGFTSCYSRMSRHEPAPTITVKFTSPASSKCIHPTQDRAITPREAARIQSFDDSFIFRGSKTEIASQIGNAVPPLLGKAMAPLFVENLEAARNAA